MRSSNGFGGGATGAGPRVQVCPTAAAESGTIVPAQEKVSRSRQRQLLPDHRGHIDTGGAGRERVIVGVVGRVGIGREDRRAYLDVDFFQDLGEAAAAFAAHHAVQTPAPEVLALGRGLELTVYRDAADQIEPEPLKGGIVRAEHPIRPHGTALQVPNVHSQHSLLR